jgi:phosphatidylglycerophosphatase A
VIKPPPIRLLERLPAGWGIMADDILAAVYALLVTSGSLYLLDLYLTSIEVAR